jgi:hypothetical protein
MPRALLFGILFGSIAWGGTIDVTAASQVTLPYGDSLLFYIGSNYASHAPGDSPYPGQVAVWLGGLPADGPTAAIPGTSAVYTPGILFSGTLESADGAIAVPLFDANAARLGLPEGSLVAGPGYRSGGSYTGPISLLTATAALSSPGAAELVSSGEAVLHIRNLGGAITFGYPGSSMTSAFSASLISPDGALSVGAIPKKVVLQQSPEPGTAGLLVLGLGLLGRRAFARITHHL